MAGGTEEAAATPSAEVFGLSALQVLPRRDANALMTQVLVQLRSAIVSQKIEPGVRLNQVSLAEQLGVSRMPVRDALRQLYDEGLIEQADATGGFRVSKLTPDDVRHVFDVRLAVEPLAVRTIALEQPSWGLRMIEAVLDRHRRLVSTYGVDQLLDVDREFHMTILDGTGNPFLRRAMIPVWSVVERVMYSMLQLPDVVERAWREHELIATTIAAGDADKAEYLMRMHLSAGLKDYYRSVPESSVAAL